MITITRKHGDTLRLRFATTVPLDGVTITAGARDSAGTARPLEAAVFDAAQGLFEVWAPAPLPVGRHTLDLKYARADQSRRTVNFFVQITEAQTP